MVRSTMPPAAAAAAAAAAIWISIAPALAEFQPYPGARPDPELERAVAEAGEEFGADPEEGTVTLLVSDDPFEDVLAFYRRLGREYAIPAIPGMPPAEGYERDLPAEIRFGPGGVQAVPSGLRVKMAYVILDGAAGIEDARDWVTIIRPFVMETDTDGTRFTYGDVRDVTAIVRMQMD